MKKETSFVATGRRKTASARIFLKQGTGKITINNKELNDYCYTEELQHIVLSPLKVVNMLGSFDIKATVSGGGPNGQAQALALGIARALQTVNIELRSPLKKEGLLRRDPRRRERSKPGQPGARKKFQFSKR